MKKESPDFSTTFQVKASPNEVFKAVNNVAGWWSEEIEGSTSKVGDVFKYHYEDVHRCEIKVTESVPGEKVVWFIKDNYFKFTEDKSEWKGTSIVFDISAENDYTSLTFTHIGLVPAYECYEICRDAWTNYIQNSLKNLILTGKGSPNASGKPQTQDEERLKSS